MEEMKRYLEYDLQWFAKDGPGGEKTEPATAKKLRDAREEGKVAKSRELNFAMDLIALFLVLKVFISYVGKGFLEEFSAVYNKMPEIVKGNGQGMSIHAADQLFRMSIIESIKIMAPFLAVGVIVAFVVRRFLHGNEEIMKIMQLGMDEGVLSPTFLIYLCNLWG